MLGPRRDANPLSRRWAIRARSHPGSAPAASANALVVASLILTLIIIAPLVFLWTGVLPLVNVTTEAVLYYQMGHMTPCFNDWKRFCFVLREIASGENGRPLSGLEAQKRAQAVLVECAYTSPRCAGPPERTAVPDLSSEAENEVEKAPRVRATR
jgi:hypothetical protein